MNGEDLQRGRLVNGEGLQRGRLVNGEADSAQRFPRQTWGDGVTYGKINGFSSIFAGRKYIT